MWTYVKYTTVINTYFGKDHLRLCNYSISSYFFKFYLFTYLVLAALSLHCRAVAFSSCGERGLLFVVVRGLLIAVASLVAEHGL